MLRMVATDLDQTLLEPDGSVCDETVDILQKLSEKGVYITLCSGRPIEPIKKLSERLGINCPIVSFNGALIVTPNGDMIQKTIPEEKVLAIMTFCHSCGYYAHFYSNGLIYTERKNELTLHDSVSRLTSIVELGTLGDKEMLPAFKIMVITEQDRVEQVSTSIAENFPDMHVTVSD